MPAPATIDELLDLSQKSGILDKKGLDDYLERKRKEAAIPSAPDQLAEAMVRDGLLTRFQAEQLLQGKWRNFLIANKYKLLERLGEGGMGAVFLCEHVRLRRRVALKVLPPDQANNPGVVQRFEREARAVAALDHPNIVKVHDVDEEDKKDRKLHYLVMEYVEGASLQDIVRKKGPMDPVRAAHYVLQAALGLHHAHEAGLVHRDVKPGNILLDRGGVVKVLDLGLARFFNDQGDNLTREHDANAILGTADYLAPEQAIDSQGVDYRADIYSLGMTFYYLLAGQAPFAHGTLNQKLIWHQLRQPEPVSTRRPDVPPEMTAVLDRMIAKDPADRFQTTLEVARALAPWVEVPIGPPPEDEMPELSRAALGSGSASSPGPLSGESRRPAAATSPSLALLSASSLRAGLAPVPPRTDMHLGDTVPDVPTDIAEAPAEPGVDWDRVIFWGRIAAFAVVLLGSAAGLAWWALSRPTTRVVVEKGDEDVPRRKTSPSHVGPAPWQPPPPPRLNLDTLGAITVLQGHKGAVEHVAFAPDGKRAVSCSHDRVALIWEIATGQVVHRLAGHTSIIHDVAYSPDGKHVVTAGFDRTLRLWDAGSGKEARQFKGHTARVSAVAFSPDGKYILSGAGERENDTAKDCTLRLWEVAGGREVRQFTGHENSVWSVAFSPNGRRAVSGSYDGTARVWEVATGREVCCFREHKAQVHAVAFSPDGRRVASGGGDGKVRLWDPANAKQEREFTGHSATVAGVAFSADGKHLLSASDDRSVRLWDADSGQQVGTFLGHTQSAWGVCFSPDGRLALSCGSDNTVRLWGLPRFVEVVRGGLLYEFPVSPDKVPAKVRAVAVSPDGRLLLSAGQDRVARLWGIAGGKELRRFQGHTGTINAVAFSPDGLLIATASDDRSVRLWDPHKDGGQKQILGTAGAVRGVTFTPDGRLVLAGGDDGVARLWDAGSGKKDREFKGHAGPINGVAVSPDARLVLTAGADGTARVWDLASGKEQRSLKEHAGAVRAVAFAPDGRLALSAGVDKKLRLWEVETGKVVRVIPIPADVSAAAFSPDGLRVLAADGGVWQIDGKVVQGFGGNRGPVSSAVFTPDGRRAVSCSSVGQVRVWGLPRPGTIIGEVRRYEGHRQTLDRAAVSPDGRYALSCGLGKDAVVVLWEVASGLEVHRFRHPAGVRFATFAPDGRHFLSCAEDGKARLWDIAGGKEVRSFQGHNGTVWWAAFTKDGQHLFTGGGDHTARLWDAATGEELQRFEGHQAAINSVAVTPDGRLGLTASWDKTVRVWNLATGKEVRCFRDHTAEARAVTVSPDGKLALSGGSDRVLRLWEIETGRPVRQFAGHTGEVYFVDFSADGKRVVSAGADRSVRLWDAASGVTTHVYAGHTAPVPTVVFTPDGRFVLSVSQDQTLRLWGLPPLQK